MTLASADLEADAVNAIRALSMDAVQRAGVGAPRNADGIGSARLLALHAPPPPQPSGGRPCESPVRNPSMRGGFPRLRNCPRRHRPSRS